MHSKRDPEFDSTFSRIFIISHLSKVSSTFGGMASASLRNALRDAGVAVELTVVDPLALDSDIEQQLARTAEFEPDGVLVLIPTRVAGVAMDRISGATIDASLFVSGTEDRVWRATVKVTSGGADIDLGGPAAREFASSIAERLIRDRLIPSPPDAAA